MSPEVPKFVGHDVTTKPIARILEVKQDSGGISFILEPLNGETVESLREKWANVMVMFDRPNE